MSKQVDAGLQLSSSSSSSPPPHDPKHPKPHPAARLRYLDRVECGATLQPTRQSVPCLRMWLGKRLEFKLEAVVAASPATTGKMNSLTSFSLFN